MRKPISKGVTLPRPLRHSHQNYVEKKFYLFGSDGNFIEEMAMNENLSKHITYWAGGTMSKYKGQLYMTDFKSGKLIKF